MKMDLPEKLPKLLERIQRCIAQGKYFDTRHATDRRMERKVTRPEILYVLKNGKHEERKDKFEKKFNAWNYAIRGKTVDGRELRIIVSFDENNMLIITVIDLEK